MNASRLHSLILSSISLSLSVCNAYGQKPNDEAGKITITTVQSKAVTVTDQYVCQIHSQRHIKVRALEKGYLLEAIAVKEGQAVKKGDLLFKVVPVLLQAKLDAELAERDLAQLELNNAKRPGVAQNELKMREAKLDSELAERDLAQLELIKARRSGAAQNELKMREAKLAKAKLDAELAERDLARLELNKAKRSGVAQNELKMPEAKPAKARAKAALAGAAEVIVTRVRAPFDGIIDRVVGSYGTLVEEGDILMALHDNSTMWVYFNVPEAQYLESKAGPAQHAEDQQIELVLANGDKFPQTGKIGAIEANFNNEKGRISFRADFPNPKGLLRHGQTGNVLIKRVLNDAVVVPRRATLEALDKRYVYKIDKDGIARRREIVIRNELDGQFVVKTGVRAGDKIVLEGVRRVHDGDKVQN